MTVNELSKRYPQGSVVVAHVIVVKFFEAVVQLEDGTQGFVRNRELSWGPEPDHAAEIVHKGQRLKAMVLGVDHFKGRLKLSIRQAVRDPWKDIEQRYKVGQVVRCRVTSILKRVAFVELEPAVEGYIPLREISKKRPHRMDQVIWIGDTVDAVITSLQWKKRRVFLSVRKHLAQLENHSARARYDRDYFAGLAGGGVQMSELISDEGRQVLLNFTKTQQGPSAEASVVREALPGNLASRLSRILVADDDPSFKTSLRSLLQRLGHQVDVAESAEQAVSLCNENRFDLVLMDLMFRRGKMDGLQAAVEIASARRDLPILMMTGLTSANPDRSLISHAREAGAAGILWKPIPLRALTDRMALIADGKDCWDEELTATNSNLPSRINPALMSVPHHVDFQQAINQELMKLQKETHATACTLFHMALETRMVSVVGHSGAPLAAYDTNKYTLQATPIQDVIKQGLEIFEEDISRNPQKYKYLNLINYVSCIGLPVEMLGQTKYGIFLFHPEKAHFTSEHRRLARVSASVIGSIINRGELERVVRKVQPLVFAGQIGSTLIHELNNRLGSVLNYAESLLVEEDIIEKDISAAMDSNLRNRVRNCITNLESNTRGMEQIASLYLGLMSVENRDVVRLNETVQRALSVMAPVAERHQVELDTDFEADLPSTVAVGTWLEQAFVNVALNAIQHIHMSKGEGKLVVQTRLARHAHALSLQVLFIDNGPGIHAQHLEHIFDLGFSTRTDGTGLGLFATRGLIEALGGKIKVHSSVMLVGTQILIEVPLIVPSVEELAS